MSKADGRAEWRTIQPGGSRKMTLGVLCFPSSRPPSHGDAQAAQRPIGMLISEGARKEGSGFGVDELGNCHLTNKLTSLGPDPLSP